MHNYRRLIVWNDSRSFVAEIYKATSGFPQSERFGLTQQIRRASVSIPSNIAEGAGRETPAEFARFLRIAIGSACEVETQLDLSLDLGFIERPDHLELRDRLEGIRLKLRALHDHTKGKTVKAT